MSTIVVMPGGFHPFHAGHASLYQSAVKAFPGAEVYVAATNDQSERPFPFKIKEKLAKLAGVAPGHFVQVKSPFQAKEITQNYDPENDVLIFVRSEKDRTESPKPGGTKKDGSPAYFQPYTGKDLQPFSKHAYIEYLPTVEFGPGITSASEIRAMWPKLNDKRKTAMVMSLYPATQSNPALAANVVKLLDAGMGVDVNLQEVFDTKASTATSQWDTSDPDMIKFNFTASNGVEYQLDFLEPYIGPENMSPYDYSDSDEVYENSKFVSFEQITKDMKGGYPVVKQGIEGTGAAAEVFGIVVNAIVQYVKKFKPSLLYFQAAEPGRRALYARMIKRVLPSLPGWTSQTNGGGEFGVYNTKKVKNAMPVQEKMKMGATTEPIEEDLSRRGFLRGAGAMAAGASLGGVAKAADSPDPNRLIAIVNIEGESKEFDLTGKFKGDVKSQLRQADEFLTNFLEKRDINFSNLELRYQGAVLRTQNTGSVNEKMKMGATIEPIEESNISESLDYLEEK